MEWVKRLHGATVGLDTAPLIYFVELHPKYLPLVDPFFEAANRGDIRIVTSTLTLTELQVHPSRHGNQGHANLFSRMLLNSSHLTTFPRLGGYRRGSGTHSRSLRVKNSGFNSACHGAGRQGDSLPLKRPRTRPNSRARSNSPGQPLGKHIT